MQALLLVAELDGPTIMARIGIMRALNRKVVREFDSSRKDTHWGKRKLKRDNDDTQSAFLCLACVMLPSCAGGYVADMFL
jgi:hypothetical protein